MNEKQLTKLLQESFRIEIEESSLDYVMMLVEDSVANAPSDEAKDAVIAIADDIVEKYNMASEHHAITTYIAQTLLKNMTPEDIEYVLKAYSSPEYAKFFEIIGEVLNGYSADVAAMIDAGLDRKPQDIKVIM
jgi:formylmethanofuran dehydrogenase subunit E-like metal-binding protein